MKLTCNLVEVNKYTANNRLYTEEALQKAVDKFNEKENVVGELEPENSGNEINFANISHKLKDLKLEEGKLVADIEILSTPSGKELINHDLNNFELFPRFIGALDPNDNTYVVIEDLISIDLKRKEDLEETYRLIEENNKE